MAEIGQSLILSSDTGYQILMVAVRPEVRIFCGGTVAEVFSQFYAWASSQGNWPVEVASGRLSLLAMDLLQRGLTVPAAQDVLQAVMDGSLLMEMEEGVRGLTEQEIGDIPTRRLMELGELASHPTCVVCMEELKEGEEVTVLQCPCRQPFHPPCLATWLQGRGSCPA